MTFSRFVLLAASIAASVAFAPALAQEHEVGHWWPTPVGSSHFNGFVSRFPAGTRSGEVHATPLEDPRLQVPHGGQEGKYYDITLKRGTTAGSGSGDMALKGQNILQNAPSAGAGDSTSWVRVAQPHTTAYEPYMQIELENVQVAPGAAGRDVLLGGRTADTAPNGQNALRSGPRTGEQKYMEIKLKEVLISGVIQNGNPAAPPTNPASTAMPKLHGVDVKPIAINTPLRTLPNRSPVAEGPTNTLMLGPVAGPARR